MPLRRLGIFLIIISLLSFVLHLIGAEFIVLSWVDMWGTTTGYAIRAGILALAVVFLIISHKYEQ